MTRLLISLKTISPLYVGASKPYGSFLETRTDIPGSVLRGAVAAKTLPDCAAPEFKHNHEACAVKEICPFYVLTTDVPYPLCPVSETGHPTAPPLRTSVTCKAAPGFLAQDQMHEPKHGVSDTLLHHLAFHEARRYGAQPRQLPPQRCAICRAALEPFSKRYIKESPGRYRAVQAPPTRRMTRVAINRARETAEAGLLYSVQCIAERTQFAGYMTLPEGWDDRWVQELKRVLGSIDRLGGEQTYGLGRVEVTVKEVDMAEEAVARRVAAFNEKLREVWRQYADRSVLPADTSYFTVELLTPALLATPDGTPTVQLTAAMLTQRAEELGGVGLPVLQEVNCPDVAGAGRPLMFTAPVMVGGWSEAWGLPKPPTLAAVAGSVYVFSTDALGAWADALGQIEACGIGNGCEEGFGAVRVCDPFHLEVQPV